MFSPSRWRLSRSLGALAAGLAAAIGVAAAMIAMAAPADDAAKLSAFAFAIGNRTLNGSATELTERYDRFDLVVVDGQASAWKVGAIQESGATVLGYLSVGAIERYRPWYDRLRRYRLSAWRDWEDEWFADASKAGYRRQVAEIAERRVLAKGFDGVFLDNVDMAEAIRHRDQREGMGALVAALDEVAGDRLLFAQNGARGVLKGYPAQGVAPLLKHLDGWNREDVTWTYDFDRRRYKPTSDAERRTALGELGEIAATGATTTATDYVDLGDGLNAAECAAVDNAQGVGASAYLGNVGLNVRAVDANPPECG